MPEKDINHVAERLEKVIAEAMEPCRPRGYMVDFDLLEDALSVILAQQERVKELEKAQMPRVMTYDEMIKAEVCFLEVKGINEIAPYIRYEIFGKSLWNSPYMINADGSFMKLATREEYQTVAHCWTAGPTDEQREAEAWPE